MAAYYNEIDPYAAQWLRNLIIAGHIAPGDVDERSIEDVHPDDLKPYTQCHFFAGIGAWSLALRRAGWPDSRPIWTGSCPCQPFSAAGAGAGFDDERHLWPSLHWLIKERRPGAVAGEQVASKDAAPWLDLVQTDMEALGYAFGAVAFPSAGVGAPHIRDRTYWLADTNSGTSGQGRQNFRGRTAGGDAQSRARFSSSSMPVGLANLHSDGRNQGRISEPTTGNDGAERNGGVCRVGNASSKRLGVGVGVGGIPSGTSTAVKGEATQRAGIYACKPEQRGPVNGIWSDADWLFCQDGKWRPVEPGTFPLANGAASRVGRLRAYGNAINVEAATQFIAAYLETQQDSIQ